MVFTQTFSVWVFYLKTLGSLLRAFCYQAFSFLGPRHRPRQGKGRMNPLLPTFWALAPGRKLPPW